MKKLSIITAALLLGIGAFSQENTATAKNVYVRETLDVTTQFNKAKFTPGLVLVGTSRSGYKIYANTRSGKSEILVKDPSGNPVQVVGRRKYLNAMDGLHCFECIDVRRDQETTEECYEVVCTNMDKDLNSAKKNTNR